MTTFQRARSDEQRAERRRVILDAAAAMLSQMPTAEVTLVELARRVGLARSNVLRYFESREAVLLELLATQMQDWISALDAIAPFTGTAAQRGEQLATALATSLEQRPVLCDLLSAQAGVLERNISTDVAVQHKQASGRSVAALTTLAQRHVPELDNAACLQLVTITILMTAAAWPNSQPPAALQAAYNSDPAIGAMRMDFTDIVTQTLQITIAGLLTRSAPSAPSL